MVLYIPNTVFLLIPAGRCNLDHPLAACLYKLVNCSLCYVCVVLLMYGVFYVVFILYVWQVATLE
jgi:hypothetical protein